MLRENDSDLETPIVAASAITKWHVRCRTHCSRWWLRRSHRHLGIQRLWPRPESIGKPQEPGPVGTSAAVRGGELRTGSLGVWGSGRGEQGRKEGFVERGRSSSELQVQV